MRLPLSWLCCAWLVACGGRAVDSGGEFEPTTGGRSTIDSSGGAPATGGVSGSPSTGGAGAIGGTSSGGVPGGIGGGPTRPRPLCTSDLPVRTPCRLAWAGVNLAGAEFGEEIPGEVDKDYTYPGTADLDYFVAQGMTLVRLPFRWERLQKTLQAPLDPDELARLDALVTLATARDLVVVLDPHNYARYRIGDDAHVIGAGTVTFEDFADFWRRLAATFKNRNDVVFGLMNEPHDLPSSHWVEAANAALEAIRGVGADNLVLVPGNHWSGAHSWLRSDNALALLGVRDPRNHFAYEVHQYFDSDYSGSSPACTHTTAEPLFGDLTRWARQHQVRVFLGEFGAGSGGACKSAIDGTLTYLEANADVWLGFAYWAGGPWWGDYFTSISPYPDGSDKPQLDWLRPHLR